MKTTPWILEKVAAKGEERRLARPLNVRQLTRRTALLNLGIVLGSLPTAFFFLGPTPQLLVAAAVIGLVCMGVWCATVAFTAFATLARILWNQSVARARDQARQPVPEAGVADLWLDGPG
jgi:Flp pilus assembly protein TadB